MVKQPKPDSKKYTDLISEVEKGAIKIPKFQRNLVWSLEQTAQLLDSILKGYPIGTFILWRTTEQLNSVKDIGDLPLPKTPENAQVEYILDGQQRITSLYAAFLGAKIKKEGYKTETDYSEIYINLEIDIDDEENDEQIIVAEKPEGESITLNKVLNFNVHMLEIQEDYSDEHFRKIHNYSQAFNTYDFSTIVLLKEDIDSAIEVFTRINTGGQTLTLFEIMSAKTYDEKNQFDMEKKFQKLLDELIDCKYNTISSSVILNLLSLVLSKNRECKRNTILSLDKNAIIKTWDDVISAIKESITYMRTVYGIPVSNLLPYDSLLVPFGYFFYYQKDQPKGEQRKYLEEFFWRISLSMRYSSATESKLAQDIKRIDQILQNNRPNYDDIKVFLDSPRNLIDTNFSAGSSYCKAILCLLAYHQPKDFQNNGKVILDNSYLKLANSKNYHHFFPKAYLKKQNIGNANSLVNITLVSSDLNKRSIRAKAPSIYILGFLEENEDLPDSLKSHLIGDIDDFGISSNDYNIFLQKRAELIYKQLKNRIELKHKKTEEDLEIKKIILEGESEKVEFKSTLRFNPKANLIDKKLEYIVAKTISAFLNSEGGILIIGVDDKGTVLGLEKDLEELKNLDKFELHLRQIIKSYLGDFYEKYVKVDFPIIENKPICVVKVSRSGTPVFIKNEGVEEFFVRNGNASIPKDRKEQSEYEKLHWG